VPAILGAVQRLGVVTLAAILCAGCLSANPEGKSDDADAAPAADAATDAGGQDATPIPSCAERLPGRASVEDPATRHCYYVGSTIDFYPIAVQDCVADEAHAVQLSGEAEAHFVAEQLLLIEASWWIGLERSESEAGWTWVTGDDLGDWNDWGAPPSGDGDCVELFVDPVGDCALGCWNDLDCAGHEKGAICELEP
jgi:hypothetical protein